ncbi:hypothetical protein NL533_32895, partial [Klebsiella pneumoniae]|nr:hypothetical protein [Klebsiella pneumoniae]
AKQMLLWPWTGARQKEGFIGERKKAGQGAAKEIHLVEAAFAGALGVQRHRDDDICRHGSTFAVSNFGELLGEPFS